MESIVKEVVVWFDIKLTRDEFKLWCFMSKHTLMVHLPAEKWEVDSWKHKKF